MGGKTDPGIGQRKGGRHQTARKRKMGRGIQGREGK
jgi:hypothetical protein